MADKLPFLQVYAEEASKRLETLLGRPLTDAEMDRLESVTSERCRDFGVTIVNPHYEIRNDTSIGRIAGWIKNRKPMPAIVTGHGTLFRPHDEYKSTVGEMVDYLMKTRKVAKNQMFDLMREGRSPDEPEVKALDQRQKIFKLLANSFYGA